MNHSFLAEPRPYLLKNKIQHYEWGTRNDEAFIPQLQGVKPEKDRPYAELWMGAHPTASSEVVFDGETFSLDRLIAHHPLEILGERISKTFSGKLPFLFKVLSAGETLSIQAHPNKIQAELLHAMDSAHYPDDNHKPEIAIAIDTLTAFAGFKPCSTIISTLSQYVEISDFIGKKIVHEFMQVQNPSHLEQQRLVQKLYSLLLNRSFSQESLLSRSIDRLYNRLMEMEKHNQVERLFIRLRKKYSGPDVGLFFIFLLNLIHLNKGEAIFLKAGVPHVYVRGTIVECMANSDNVVRAGLTHKYKDVKTLNDILFYETTSIPILGKGEDLSGFVYHTPAQEFQVTYWQFDAKEERAIVRGDSPNIILITRGEVRLSWKHEFGEKEAFFKKGQSILVPATMKAFTLSAESPAQLFRVEVP